MAPLINVTFMARFINVKSMVPFINSKSIFIMFDKVKYLTLNICTLFSYVLLCIANLAIFCLLILSFQFYTPNVDLNSVAITFLKPEAGNLTATFDLTFIFHSPIYNNGTVYYSDLEARVLWSGKDNITLASTTLSPFIQEAYNKTVIKAELTMVNEFSNNNDLAIGIGAERDTGFVKIDVNLIGLLTLRHVDSEILRFNFDGLYVKFRPGSNNGSWTNNIVPLPIMMHTIVV